MLDLKRLKIKSKVEAIYIPILDKDPIFAAHSLTKADLRASFDLMKEVFKEITEDSIIHTILVDTILHSQSNFMWYVTFFKEIEKILKEDSGISIPYDKCPPSSSNNDLRFQYPFLLKGYIVKYIKNLTGNMDPINLYRTQYILAEYDLEDFQDEVYPVWYLLKDTIVYEQYNEKTNVRVRIAFINKEFRYFISGASDNWQQIMEVPLEMDHVVSALLFRSYSQD